MPRSSKLGKLKEKIAAKVPLAKPVVADVRNTARVIVGTLLVANLIAALFAFRPWAETPLELEEQLVNIRKQSIQTKLRIGQLEMLTKKSAQALNEGDGFMGKYFLGRRTAASTLVSELNSMAKAAGIKPKEHSFAFEGVEGSDTIAMMTITAAYEGNYGDLIQYVNRIDRSPRFFIVESLAATPQQGGQGVLNIAMKVNVFVREDNSLPAVARAAAAAPPAAAAPAAAPVKEEAQP
jgi:type IV pilus assembly protein PilO